MRTTPNNPHFPINATNITTLLLKYIFIPFGIFMEPSYRKIERFYSTIFLLIFFALFLGQVKAYDNLDSFLFVLDNTMYVIATLVATVFLLMVFRGKHIFQQFYHYVIFDKYASSEFFDETNTRLKKLAIHIGPMIFIGLGGTIVYPILNAAFTDVQLGSPSTLIYLSYYPWTVDSVSKYCGTIALQLCSGSVVCSVVGCMILFILYCIVVLEAHCNILDRKIKLIDDRKQINDTSRRIYRLGIYHYSNYEALNVKKRYKNDDKTFDELFEVMKYHQFVSRFTNNIMACCTRIVDTTTAGVFSCIILLIIMFLMSRGNYMYQLKVLSMSIITFCLFIIQCYMGEVLYEVNLKLLQQAYNLKWYKRPVRYRKLLLTFMIRCQQPYQIKAFNMLPVNYTFFTSVLKNIYTVLQLILRMQRN